MKSKGYMNKAIVFCFLAVLALTFHPPCALGAKALKMGWCAKRLFLFQ
jgi:hypothetical protein